MLTSVTSSFIYLNMSCIGFLYSDSNRSSTWSICESKSVVNCFCWLSFIEACLLLCLVLFVSSLSLKICGNPKSASGMLFLLLLVARRYHKLGILSIDLWSGHGSSKLRYTTHSGLKALIWTPVVLWISAWKHPWLPSPSTYFSELWTCTLWFVSLEGNGRGWSLKRKKVWFMQNLVVLKQENVPDLLVHHTASSKHLFNSILKLCSASHILEVLSLVHTISSFWMESCPFSLAPPTQDQKREEVIRLYITR